MKTFSPFNILLVLAAAAALIACGAPDSDLGRKDPHGHETQGHEAGEADRERVELPDSLLRRSGVALDTVRMRRMRVRIPLQGKIAVNEDRTAHLHARFPGVIVEVRKRLGDRVRKGDVLAVLESNESLSPYELVSRVDGIVVNRHAAPGEAVTQERELFTVADLSTVWVDFQVYRQDYNRLKTGQPVRLVADGLEPVETRLSHLFPILESHSQTLLARAELRNDDGRWTPGLFVTGEVAVEAFEAPAVHRAAVQRLTDGPVVFVREAPGSYQARGVTLGRRDGDWLELLSDPRPGEIYVRGNSFLLKAELGKGEAGHDH